MFSLSCTRFSLMINFVGYVPPLRLSSPKFSPFQSVLPFLLLVRLRPRPAASATSFAFFRARSALRMHAFSAFGFRPPRPCHGMIYRVPSQICPTPCSCSGFLLSLSAHILNNRSIAHFAEGSLSQYLLDKTTTQLLRESIFP